jgi:hypothetical protein
LETLTGERRDPLPFALVRILPIHDGRRAAELQERV